MRAVRQASTPVPLEHKEQAGFFDEIAERFPKWANHCFSIPNGAWFGGKSFLMAKKMKREGLKRGVPDIFCAIRTSEFSGLFIEMKRVKGSDTSPEQLAWQELLRTQGFKSEICKGRDAAIEVFEQYLKGAKV